MAGIEIAAPGRSGERDFPCCLISCGTEMLLDGYGVEHHAQINRLMYEQRYAP